METNIGRDGGDKNEKKLKSMNRAKKKIIKFNQL
jgi:hypothetical protein